MSLRNSSVTNVQNLTLIKTLWVTTLLRSIKSLFRSIHVIFVARNLLLLQHWPVTGKSCTKTKRMPTNLRGWFVSFVANHSPCFQIWSVTSESFILELNIIWIFMKGLSLLSSFSVKLVNRNLLGKLKLKRHIMKYTLRKIMLVHNVETNLEWKLPEIVIFKMHTRKMILPAQIVVRAFTGVRT